ncbi:MAG: hypothetical protein ACKVP4_12050 [Hyphomicrobium sp.]
MAYAKNPAASAQAYKKAATSARRAGDTTLELNILREATTPPPANAESAPAPIASLDNTASAPNLHEASAPPQTKSAGARRPWSGQKDDCESAGQLERNTAAWYDMCVPFDLAELEKSRPNAYKPPISPQDLTARAIDECKDVSGDEKRQCIFDAKLRILLAADPNVRAECASRSWGNERIVCVDAVYLHGPGANVKAAVLRDEIRRSLNKLPDYADPEVALRVPENSVPMDSRCAPGQGMKPKPGAFGAWSCQPLGLIWLAPNKPNRDTANPQGTDAPNSPDPILAFEERVNNVAASAVAAVAHATSANLSAADRETCTVAAFAAVHSILKGGAPPVAEMCRPMTNAARAELAYYAGAHIDTVTNPGVEELLQYLNARNPSSGGLNSGDLGAPHQAIVSPAADCNQAESHWKAAEDIKSLVVYQDHLSRFPSCNFAALAVARIEHLKK